MSEPEATNGTPTAPFVKGVIWQKIHAVMKKVTHIEKEKSSGIAYEFVSHDNVVSTIRATLIEQGIVCKQDVVEHHVEPYEDNRKNKGFFTAIRTRVYLINKDMPEDFVCIDSFGYGLDRADKGPGKAMSYAFKYALLKVFLFETGDDPDLEPEPLKPVPEPEKTFEPTDVYKDTSAQKKFLLNSFKKHDIEDTNTVAVFAKFMNGKTFAVMHDFLKLIVDHKVPISRVHMLCTEIQDKPIDEVEKIIVTYYKQEG